ncbi:MAG: glycosyltransferase family 39 protein [Bacteroidales bacterium]|nr:glycosyltransferase family 39 protein [Bacteroidales bacterium]
MPRKKPVKKIEKKAEIVTPEKKSSSLLNQRLALVIFGIVLYGSTISFDYTLDDTLMITGNEYTQKGFDGINDIFTTDVFVGFFGNESSLVAGGRYRPFTHFTFAVEHELFGDSPHMQHFLNILFYVLLLLSLFAFLKQLFPPESRKWYLQLPFIITLLFAAHPLHTEVVSNIKGRDEIITMLTAILSMHLLLKWLKSKKILQLLGSIVLFFIALLSKENAITWVAIFPFILWFFTESKRKDYFIATAILLIPSLIYIYIRSQVVGGVLVTEISPELLNNPFVNSTKGEEIATVIFTWLLYFKLLIFPHPLTHDYYPKQIAIRDFSDPMVWLAIIVVLISLYFAFRGLKKKKLWSFGIILFWGSFSISSNLLFNIGTFMNERFMFVPLLGFTIILAWFLHSKIKNAKTITYVLLIILGLYTVKTISRSFAWKDNFTLFMTDVKTSSNSAKVNVSAAELLLKHAEAESNYVKRNQMVNEAIGYLNKAQEIHPTYYGVYDLRGKAWFLLKDYGKSFQDYKYCMQLKPGKANMLNNIYLVGLACIRDSVPQSGHEIFDYLIAAQPDSTKHYFQKALMYDIESKPDQAIVFLDAAIHLDSNFVSAWNKKGEIYGRVYNDLQKSQQFLLKAYSISPNNISVLENLGVLYGIAGQFEESKKYLLKAHKQKPDDQQIKFNLGQTYDLLGMPDSAAYYRIN